MKAIIGALIAFSVVSNIWLWINLWMLKERHFEFEKRILDLLKEFCQQPAKDCSGEGAEQTKDKV